MVAVTGAIEITVHGWDISVACGAHRPVPPGLAVLLLPIAPLLITPGTRPGLMTDPVRLPGPACPGDQLVASPRSVAKRGEEGSSRSLHGDSKILAAQQQPGGHIVKEHGRTPGTDAQEIRPSTAFLGRHPRLPAAPGPAAFIAIGGATVLPAAAADAATTHPAVSQSHHWCGWRWDTCCYGGDWGGGWWHHRWRRPFFEHHGLGGGFDHGRFDHGPFDHRGFDHRGGG